MSLCVKKLLTALLLCALPALAIAAETAQPADGSSKTAPSQTAPAATVTAAPAAAPTVAELPKTQQPVRIGYADIARIGSESKLGKTALTQAKDKQAKFQSQIEGKRKQLDKQKSALEAKFASLTPQQRETKAKEFQKKVEEFQKFGMNAEKELQTLQEDVQKKLFEAIEQAAVECGKNKGLALVVIKRELLYMADGVDAQDVSDDIIALLNAKNK